MCSILVADSDLLFRAGINALLAEYQQHSPIDEVTNTYDLVRTLSKRPIDLVLLDLALEGPTGEALVRQVKLIAPRTAILGLIDSNDVNCCGRAIKAGLDAIVQKNCNKEELILAIDRVISGKRYIGETIAESLAIRAYLNVSELPHHRLTERELDIFYRIAKGCKYKSIASDLSISEKTVSSHKKRLLRKMGLSNISDLVCYAIRQKMLS